MQKVKEMGTEKGKKRKRYNTRSEYSIPVAGKKCSRPRKANSSKTDSH